MHVFPSEQLILAEDKPLTELTYRSTEIPQRCFLHPKFSQYYFHKTNVL